MNTHVYASRPPATACRRGLGFTLVEVMISVALVLIVILGINQVFALTSQAVGSGQALSEITRNARMVQNIVFQDLTNADVDGGPYFLIRSAPLAAFRSQPDMLTDADFAPTDTVINLVDRAIRSVPRDGFPAAATADNFFTPRTILSERTKRVDQISFFARLNGRRQTGDINTFTSNVSASEAYITYGHLRQPGNDIESLTGQGANRNGRDPGFLQVDHTKAVGATGRNFVGPQANNPNNYFATQWVLGRKVLLLREPNANKIIDQTTGQAVQYYTRKNKLTPLAFNSRASDDGTVMDSPTGSQGPDPELEDSYYDLAGTTIERFNVIVGAAAGAAGWQDDLIYRFTGYPRPVRPLNPIGAARTVPCLLTGCTQFVVEYAGDYLTQEKATAAGLPSGRIIAAATANGGNTDGEIDYCIDPVTRARTVRWYGYPRDTDGDGSILTPEWAKKNGKEPQFLRDTLPLRDVARVILGSGFAGYPFERDVKDRMKLLDNSTDTPDDYATNDAKSLGPLSEYIACWATDTNQSGFPRPRLIRITIALDDPRERLGSEQFFEYVIELP